MSIQSFPSARASAVKSIQAFSINLTAAQSSNTATISSVDTTRAAILHNGVSGGDSGDIRESKLTLALTDATTITASRSASSPSAAVTVKGYVIEYY